MSCGKGHRLYSPSSKFMATVAGMMVLPIPLADKALKNDDGVSLEFVSQKIDLLPDG